MATIQIDIPVAADLTRIVDAMAGTFSYQPFLPDAQGNLTIANPETKNAFAKRQLALWVKSIVRGWESQLAAETARATAITSANSINVT